MKGLIYFLALLIGSVVILLVRAYRRVNKEKSLEEEISSFVQVMATVVKAIPPKPKKKEAQKKYIAIPQIMLAFETESCKLIHVPHTGTEADLGKEIEIWYDRKYPTKIQFTTP